MPLLKKVQGGYILHTEKRFFDLDWMKKMQKTRRKWHETKVFSFGSVCHNVCKNELRYNNISYERTHEKTD